MKKMLTFFILWTLVLAGILSMAGCSMRFRKVRIGTAGIGGNSENDYRAEAADRSCHHPGRYSE